MVSRLVAIFVLIGAMVAASVGNFWFTFGLWPKSWTSMVVFWLLNFAILELLKLVMEVKET